MSEHWLSFAKRFHVFFCLKSAIVREQFSLKFLKGTKNIVFAAMLMRACTFTEGRGRVVFFEIMMNYAQNLVFRSIFICKPFYILRF